MTDVSAAFRRALAAHAATAGCSVEIVSASDCDWASATFVGQRHELRLHAAAGPALTVWLAGLPETEWRLPGHIVAYVAAETCGADVVLSALTIHES